jgi:hypothetical protein
MRKLSILAAATAVAVTALAASTSANAAYSIIRWDGTGFCQIWDHNFPMPLWPTTYKTVAPATLPTFIDAINAKTGMVTSGACTF